MSDYDDDQADRAEHHQCLEDELEDKSRAVAAFLDSADLAEAAAHVLWHTNNDGGYQPGHFVSALLKAWDRADLENRIRLSIAYPEYGWAIEQARIGQQSRLRDAIARASYFQPATCADFDCNETHRPTRGSDGPCNQENAR